jgi:hypothetical protein
VAILLHWVDTKVYPYGNFGTCLIRVDVGAGTLLMLNSLFEKTTLDQVAGVLKHNGQPKSLDDLEDAMRLGITAQWRDCHQSEHRLKR